MKKILIVLDDDKSFNIKKILKNVNSEKYHWYIDNYETEIFYKNDIYTFQNKLITLEKLISIFSNEDYYVVNLTVQAYNKKNSESGYQCIKNKNEFLTSECDLLFRVFDSYYCQLVIKDDDLTKKIYKNLMLISDDISSLEFGDVTEEDIFSSF